MYFIEDEAEQFPFMKELAAHTDELREEYLRVGRQRLKPWHDTHITDQSVWNACPLIFAERKHRTNWDACPVTRSLVENVPGLIAAGFYVLSPHAHLLPHNNMQRDVYRLHLGIIVPEGCSFRVGDQVRDWKEGEWLMFDPNYRHEAWNRSDEYRVILLMDVWRDPASRPFKDRAFHKADGVKFAMAQYPAGRKVTDFVGRSTLFRRLIHILMGGKLEPPPAQITDDDEVRGPAA